MRSIDSPCVAPIFDQEPSGPAMPPGVTTADAGGELERAEEDVADGCHDVHDDGGR